MTPDIPKQGTVEGLQILRALAAVMIVFHHARASVPGAESWTAAGETGVDVFFVISGFVMSYTTALVDVSGRLRQRATEVGRFLEKRLLRIVPLYVLALLWVSRRDLSSGVVSRDLLQDLAFIPHPNASYPQSLVPSLQQGWTLNFEMFFYVLFAASLMFGAWRTRWLIGTLLVLVLVGAARTYSHWPAHYVVPMWTGAPNDVPGILATFYTDDILLDFGYGILLHRLTRVARAPDWPRWVYFALAALGMAGLVLLDPLWPRGITQGIPAALVVWAGIQACAGLRLPVLELLGDASYAIYLFHWAVFGFVKPLTRLLGDSHGHLGRIVALMAAHIVVAVLAGIAIHLVIERPFMRWAKGALAQRRLVAAGALQA